MYEICDDMDDTWINNYKYERLFSVLKPLVK